MLARAVVSVPRTSVERRGYLFPVPVGRASQAFLQVRQSFYLTRTLYSISGGICITAVALEIETRGVREKGSVHVVG